MAPATDLVVPEIQRKLAEAMAEAMLEAQRSLQPAVIGIGSSILTGVTHNRRAGFSPYVNSTTIDPNLGVMRVDNLQGSPIATIWNYAIHGTCWGASNMLFSSDIMGGVNNMIEAQLGGYSLFINADAGDVSPDSWVCAGAPQYGGAPNISAAVMDTRSSLLTSSNVSIQVNSKAISFGPTQFNVTLARDFNCTSGGPLDICSYCAKMDCNFNPQMDSSWVENNPVFSAFRIRVENNNTLFTSIPGEALVELGFQIRGGKTIVWP